MSIGGFPIDRLSPTPRIYVLVGPSTESSGHNCNAVGKETEVQLLGSESTRVISRELEQAEASWQGSKVIKAIVTQRECGKVSVWWASRAGLPWARSVLRE
jgi:hypothetical protein